MIPRETTIAVCCALLASGCGTPKKAEPASPPPTLTDDSLADQAAADAGRTGELPRAEFDEASSWAFEPPRDEFPADAALDLRSLNEPVAGEHGFVSLSKDRMGFVDGRGEPIRFWSVVDYGFRLKPEQMRRHARFLAKYGVNMVRVHAQLCSAKEGAKLESIDEEVLDGIFRWVAAAKAEGIYLTISPYWAHVEKVPQSWGIEGYGGKSNPWALLFFDKKLQNAYSSWVRELYTRKNPYTNLPLRHDPAVAIAQIQNEDSLLFYTMQSIEEPHAGRLRALFGEFLKKKYGSLEKAQLAWGGTGHPQDDYAKGQAGLIIVWEFTAAAPTPPPAKARRMQDQLEFLALLQRRFYADTGTYLKKTLGLKQLVNATNWKSADPILLDDVERWTYTANDIAAVNRYTGGAHLGEMVGWRVDPGQFFTSESVLRKPDTFPGAVKQTVGQPFIITESSWVMPTLYQTEGPFLAAAYNSLTGVDSLYWFSHGDETWSELVWPWWKAQGDKNSLKKWDSTVPQQVGMFPAAALAFRRGLIAKANEPAVHEERSLSGLWARRMPIISEAGKYDPNRDSGAFAPTSSIKQEVDRLAFFVGPVQVKYGGDEQKSRVVDLAQYIDAGRKRVRSSTGELELDYEVGLCTVKAPAFEGVAGFVKQAGGSFKLGSVRVDIDNEYAAVSVVSLDELPLARSKKVLVQIGTVMRPTGWRVRPDTEEADGQVLTGFRIVDAGSTPWRIENASARITIANPGLTKATRLDVAGQARRPLPVETVDGSLSFTFPKDALYAIIE
jgi:hypothetical protein